MSYVHHAAIFGTSLRLTGSLSARRRSDGLGGGLQALEAGASAVRQTCYHAEPQIDLDFHIAHIAASSSHHHDPCPHLALSLPQGYRV